MRSISCLAINEHWRNCYLLWHLLVTIELQLYIQNEWIILQDLRSLLKPKHLLLYTAKMNEAKSIAFDNRLAWIIVNSSQLCHTICSSNVDYTLNDKTTNYLLYSHAQIKLLTAHICVRAHHKQCSASCLNESVEQKLFNAPLKKMALMNTLFSSWV